MYKMNLIFWHKNWKIIQRNKTQEDTDNLLKIIRYGRKKKLKNNIKMLKKNLFWCGKLSISLYSHQSDKATDETSSIRSNSKSYLSVMHLTIQC